MTWVRVKAKRLSVLEGPTFKAVAKRMFIRCWVFDKKLSMIGFDSGWKKSNSAPQEDEIAVVRWTQCGILRVDRYDELTLLMFLFSFKAMGILLSIGLDLGCNLRGVPKVFSWQRLICYMHALSNHQYWGFTWSYHGSWCFLGSQNGSLPWLHGRCGSFRDLRRQPGSKQDSISPTPFLSRATFRIIVPQKHMTRRSPRVLNYRKVLFTWPVSLP